MCESTMLADGAFSPIHISSNEMSFIYVDKAGKTHTLIDRFHMDITISKARVLEIRNDQGKVVAYEFRVS